MRIIDWSSDVGSTDYGVAGVNGLGDFYAGDARQAFADVDDKGLQQQFADASAKAAKAMHDLGAWLASQKASANTDFALGPERFSKMLSATEGVDIPLDQLEAIGKADLAKNQAALKQACAQFAPGATIVACTAKMKANKPPEGPVAAARKQIPELRDFVVSHDKIGRANV